jgi:FAD/FMN-containing dehydrogenase
VAGIFHAIGRRKLSPLDRTIQIDRLTEELEERIATFEGCVLPPLPEIPDATFLLPQSEEYAAYLPLYNKQNNLLPALRIVCKSTNSVAEAIKWVSYHELPFALRSGGHCYEGFSQSNCVIIDCRHIDSIEVDSDRGLVMVGAGASLGRIYRKIAAAGYALPAGSCPTVGIAGHTLGGGMGLLGRQFGLACDNVEQLTIVDASGVIRLVDKRHNPDHFWAAVGGGGGSFGAVTRFVFRMHPLSHVHTFGATWEFSEEASGLTKAIKLFDAWQRWAPKAPKSITALMTVQKGLKGKLRLRCIGQSTGSKEELESELSGHLLDLRPTHKLHVKKRTFFQAVEHFCGGNFDYDSVYFEGKSDVVKGALSKTALQTMFRGILSQPIAHVVAICDPFGGAIADVPCHASAFPYRGANTWGIQYYSQWEKQAQSPGRLAQMASIYDAMRPFMSGSAYVNYPDTEIENYAYSYWGNNLERLREIKTRVDPRNLFNHKQSIPLI